ncbi:GIMA5 GTPase, partial [Amia calva]|nr:GIMA5 GTPase [Amia calva]
VQERPNVNIVLLGVPGDGKSSAGNKILGANEFRSSKLEDETVICEKRSGDVAGRLVSVIDTPNWNNLALSNIELEEKMICHLSAPGPSAFLLVTTIKKFKYGLSGCVKEIQETFGEEAFRYTIILFTFGELLGEVGIDDHIKCSKGDLQEVLEKCGNRYHVFTKDMSNRKQVLELLDKIDDMVRQNAGVPFSNNKYQSRVQSVRRMAERLEKQYEEEEARKMGELEAIHQKTIADFELKIQETINRLNREKEILLESCNREKNEYKTFFQKRKRVMDVREKMEEQISKRSKKKL